MLDERKLRNAASFIAVMTLLGLMAYLTKGRALGMSVVAAMLAWAVFVISFLCIALVLERFHDR